jgi:hypothetical protein
MMMNKASRMMMARSLLTVCALCSLATTTPAFAQTAAGGGTPANIDPTLDVVGGTDNSGQLTSLNSVATTMVHFLVNVVARVIAVGLAIYAIMQFMKREVVWGVVSITLCGVCFFLPNLMLAISHMGA